MPVTRKASGGLGTSIVAALSRQLQAEPSIEDRHPGMTASVTHKHTASTPALQAI